MATIANLISRINEMSSRTGKFSIGKADLFNLWKDIVNRQQTTELNMSNLAIRKVYLSIAAMNADAAAPLGDDGEKILKGQLVAINNTSDPLEMGKVYRYSGTAWENVGKIGEMGQKADKSELEQLRVIDLNLFDRDTQKLGYALPENGVFQINATRDVSDYIDVEGLTKIRLTTTDDKLVCGGVQFFNADKAGIGITVGSFTSYVEEYTATVPVGSKWAVVVLRRNVAGEVLPYMGDTLVVLPENRENEVIGVRLHDRKFIVKGTDLNLFDRSTQKLGYALPISGVFQINAARDVSDYIDIEGLTKIRLTTTDDKLVCGGVQFFNADKAGNGITVGSFTSYVEEYTATVPAGSKWAVVVLRRNVAGEVLPYMGDTLVVLPENIQEQEIEEIIINDRIFNPSKSEILYSRIKNKLNKDYSIPEKPTGKKAVVFGSSNTTQYYGTWFPDLCDYLGITDRRIYGVGGSTYPIIPGSVVNAGHSGLAPYIVGQPNSMVTAIEYVLANYGDYIPDVIMINSGMNEADQNPPLGDIDVVLTKTLLEIRASTSGNYGVNTLSGAMRWCLETLIVNFPNATIIPLLPFQAQINISNNYRNNIMPLMQQMYKLMSLPVVDCFNEGGFYSRFENAPPYKYTLDGIHIKLGESVNEAGRFVQNQFLRNAFKRVYYSKSNII